MKKSKSTFAEKKTNRSSLTPSNVRKSVMAPFVVVPSIATRGHRGSDFFSLRERASTRPVCHRFYHVQQNIFLSLCVR